MGRYLILFIAATACMTGAAGLLAQIDPAAEPSTLGHGVYGAGLVAILAGTGAILRDYWMDKSRRREAEGLDRKRALELDLQDKQRAREHELAMLKVRSHEDEVKHYFVLMHGWAEGLTGLLPDSPPPPPLPGWVRQDGGPPADDAFT